MIMAGDFRKGMTFQIDGKPYVILDFQHVKPGKGAAFVRTKYKNIITGATREEAFNPSAKFPKAHIETMKLAYLYDDGEMYNFMNNETFEQYALSHEDIEEDMKFVKDNDVVVAKFYQGSIFAIEPPTFAELEVTDTEPGFKGNTSTGATKPCTVETGALVYVPLFVEIGDVIQIDTRTGEYLKRI